MRGNKKGWSKGPVVGTRRARHDKHNTSTTRTVTRKNEAREGRGVRKEAEGYQGHECLTRAWRDIPRAVSQQLLA